MFPELRQAGTEIPGNNVSLTEAEDITTLGRLRALGIDQVVHDYGR